MKIPTALGRYSSFSVVSRKAHNLFDTFFPLKMLKIKAPIWFLKLVTYLMNSCTEIEFSSPHSSRIKWLQSEFCPILAVQLFPQRYSTIGNFSSFSLKCSSSSTGRFRFLEFVELELGLEGVALGAAVGAGSGRLR